MELIRTINQLGIPKPVIFLVGGLAALGVAAIVAGLRYIPNNRIGIIEKLWSLRGSVSEGRLMAFGGRAGYQTTVLRGGLHFLLWVWQYRIHRVPFHVECGDSSPLWTTPIRVPSRMGRTSPSRVPTKAAMNRRTPRGDSCDATAMHSGPATGRCWRSRARLCS